MQKSGGAVILMQQNFAKIIGIYPKTLNFETVSKVTPLAPFDARICALLAAVSQVLLKDTTAKAYPDVITFAFWCRKANVEAMKSKYDVDLRLGRGVLFHITPSNVPVNFAYSLAAGLLSGNLNIVRVPTKEFPQVEIIAKAFQKVLETAEFNLLSPYVVLVRYERDAEINRYLSSLCDVRIIWGGDHAIDEIRRAPLNPRSFDLTFADRYSICAINAVAYLKAEDPVRIARDFYNDTYLFDQNACTAPHLVIWTGANDDIVIAKERFWGELHKIMSQQYSFQPVQAVDKLTAFYGSAVAIDVKLVKMPDNLIMRVDLGQLVTGIENYRCPGGYFAEYAVENLTEIIPVVNRKYQTLSYYGFDLKDLRQLVTGSGISGIDRIVPIGKTMDFSLNWDGYDLISTLSRKIAIVN
jgi:hypothetical protein